MKISRYIWMASLTFLCFSCGRMISDRVSGWDKKNVLAVDSFPASKEVAIDLSHEYGFDFSEMKIVIMVDMGTTVFNGSYEQLCHRKVKLPAPKSGDEYYISVSIIDPVKKKMYRWSSDNTNHLSKRYLNKIELLYTGTEGENTESITLEVEQSMEQ